MYEAQLNRSWDILDGLGLSRDRVYKPTYPAQIASQFRRLDYVETWTRCYQERYFDFELIDSSLIQIRFEGFAPLQFSYNYYECPFLPSLTNDLGITSLSELDVLTSDLNNEYNDYLTQQLKSGFTPIRYDYCPRTYIVGRHPAAHFHFGFQNNIRIASKYILRPLSFILFIVRQNYPDKWQEFLSWPDAELLGREIRESLDAVSPDYWQPKDAFEMHFY